MRLNQRTVILLVVSLVVIVAVLLVTNPANAPAETPTPVEGSGPVFGEVDQTALTGISITNNETGEQVTLAKDAGGAWTITDATNTTDRAIDQTAVTTALSTFATVASSESFTTEDLASFGLDSPTYTLVMNAGQTTYTLLVGNKAPANPRYYALVNDDSTTVFVVQQTQVDNLTALVAAPPYVPPATATATFTPSPNPYSEVEQTATAAVEQTAAMDAAMTALATAEVTGEAAAVEGTEEATVEATSEATTEVEATEEATQEATEEAAPEVTAEVEATEEAAVETTEEATAEVAAAPTATPTRRPTSEPTNTPSPTPTNTPEPLPTAITVDTAARYADIPQGTSEEGFPQLGEADAPVQVTIYGSFDSPDSREFHTEVFFNLIDRVRAGEVLVTFVPLHGTGSISRGEEAAQAAICAGEQEAFWQMSDYLFARQGTLRNQAFTSASLRSAAEDVELDLDQWNECLDSDLPGDVLTAAQENAQSVSDTPTVLVNGEAVDADLDSINAAIDAT